LDEKLLKFVQKELQANNPQMQRMKTLEILERECKFRITEREKNWNGPEWGTGGQEDGQLNDYDSISKATRLLEEVKDIRDELSILKFLLKQQNYVWKQLVDESYKKPKSEESRGPAHVVNEIDEMDKMAERIQDSVRISSFPTAKSIVNFIGELSFEP
jgi:Mg2+ and Co2+ transporter CorA